jgi:Skp family chaperone for outer membrane proteins
MKIQIFAYTALLGVVLAAQAQQPPAQQPPAPKPPAPAATPKPQAPATASMANTAGTILPSRIGLISLRDALTGTAEGKKALLDLEERFGSRKTALQKKQIDIQTKQEQLNRAGSTLSDQAKTALAKDIESETKTFNRDKEDLQTDAEDAQNKVFGEIYGKMQPVIQAYATQNGYATIIDVSSEQSQSFVVWASNSTDITIEIVNLYNQAHPSTGSSPAQAPARPAAPPVTKKQ